jgi:hypothetical protein
MGRRYRRLGLNQRYKSPDPHCFCEIWLISVLYRLNQTWIPSRFRKTMACSPTPRQTTWGFTHMSPECVDTRTTGAVETSQDAMTRSAPRLASPPTRNGGPRRTSKSATYQRLRPCSVLNPRNCLPPLRVVEQSRGYQIGPLRPEPALLPRSATIREDLTLRRL